MLAEPLTWTPSVTATWQFLSEQHVLGGQSLNPLSHVTKLNHHTVHLSVKGIERSCRRWLREHCRFDTILLRVPLVKLSLFFRSQLDSASRSVMQLLANIIRVQVSRLPLADIFFWHACNDLRKPSVHAILLLRD